MPDQDRIDSRTGSTKARASALPQPGEAKTSILPTGRASTAPPNTPLPTLAMIAISRSILRFSFDSRTVARTSTGGAKRSLSVGSMPTGAPDPLTPAFRRTRLVEAVMTARSPTGIAMSAPGKKSAVSLPRPASPVRSRRPIPVSAEITPGEPRLLQRVGSSARASR